MEPRHGHSPLCLMRVSSGAWEGFYASRTYNASLTPKCWCEPTRHSSPQFCETDVYGSSDMLPGQTRGWTDHWRMESTARSYRDTGGVLLTADLHHDGREPLRKIWVHSASACLWRGDKRKVVNNGDEPWKRICSNMGPALDDDDDYYYYYMILITECGIWPLINVRFVAVLERLKTAIQKVSKTRLLLFHLRRRRVLWWSCLVCSQFTWTAVYVEDRRWKDA